MATIRDVARESGVSVATVSYVLNDGPRPVRAQTRERVLETMRRLDYHPNAMARGLVRRRMRTLGVQFGLVEPSVITNPYAAAVLQGVFAAAAEHDYSVQIFPKPWTNGSRSAAPFRDRKIDGALVIAPLDDSDLVPALAALGLPMVVVSSTSGEAYGLPCVDVDNRAGGRLAGAHLASLGHTRVALIGGPANHASSADRRTGFLDALADAGLPPPPPEYLIRSDEYTTPAGYAAARRLFALPAPPTALFASNDFIALGVLQAARECGLRVPVDLSVVGFDDTPIALMASPPLTTVRQPLTELGAEATDHLMRLLGAESGARFGVSKLPAALVHFKAPSLAVRATTAPPPRG